MSLEERLLKIYEDEDKVSEFKKQLSEKLEKYKKCNVEAKKLTEEDIMLITYGDSIVSDKNNNIRNLEKLLGEFVGDTISAVHILPMFPYTSDDGFSVTDYKKINDSIGSWEDIEKFSEKYDLMYDAVINHISKESVWFQECLKGNEKYKGYFIEKQEEFDYSNVTRPRTSPLFTTFDTTNGEKDYWTTFSEDQIDLNFESIDLATDIMELLVYYGIHGARYIRLDAIGFLWKESGTTCMHLEKTHEMIKVMRCILDMYSPETYIITETNVPHEQNISYFGNGYDEAQLVYQFPLPPLTLYSFVAENASKLSEWASSLKPLTNKTTYFNFLASHDGIGLRPTEGILNDAERKMLADNVLKNGGRVNYRTNPDKSQSPYELNINYQDALSGQYDSDEIRIKRFLGSQVILLSVVGLPAIYIHSLLGSRNDYFGVETSGINRRINREKLDYDVLVEELKSNSFRKKILENLLEIMKLRKKESAFSPMASQEVLSLNEKVFGIKRVNETTNEQIVVLVNVSKESVEVELEESGMDLFTNKLLSNDLILEPLEYKWIKIK